MFAENKNAVTDTFVVQCTQKWIHSIVLGLQLCPFAPAAVKNNTVQYVVWRGTQLSDFKFFFEDAAQFLLAHPDIETTVMITPDALQHFDDYLKALERAEKWLLKLNMEGVFQIASFHPQYRFECTKPDANENYTNRSPFPVFQLLRESSITQAAETFENMDTIGLRNAARFNTFDSQKLKDLFDDTYR